MQEEISHGFSANTNHNATLYAYNVSLAPMQLLSSIVHACLSALRHSLRYRALCLRQLSSLFLPAKHSPKKNI